MFLRFFYALRAQGIPVGVHDYLSFLAVLQRNQHSPMTAGALPTVDEFYYLTRMSLVKDERHFDRFDQVFGACFHNKLAQMGQSPEVPADWLLAQLQRQLSPEDKAALAAMDWDALNERLKQLLNEQKERHEGGNRWIGTGGTSPFGHSGYNPRGHRIGNPNSSGNRTAVKVWEQRQFRDYDDAAELGVRNVQMALRRLRRFAREGAATELDLAGTIRQTAANAGYLDIQMQAERHNHVKVLLLMDVGGSMDDHVEQTERLFSAVRSEFKHLEFFYFHNCVYDYVWRKNHRRFDVRMDTYALMRTFGADYKLIFVGDATMAPHEIVYANGSVEYSNAEAGAQWLQRLTQHFKHFVWLNPQPFGVWEYTQSIVLIKELLGGRMYPLTVKGVDQAVQVLNKK